MAPSPAEADRRTPRTGAWQPPWVRKGVGIRGVSALVGAGERCVAIGI